MHARSHARAQTCPYTECNNYYYEFMMSYKLIQPAVNIGIGTGTADLMANVIVYLQYRQIVV